MSTKPMRVDHIVRLVPVLVLLVVVGTSSPQAKADHICQYAGTAYGVIQPDPFASNYSAVVAQPGYNPGINQRLTGSATGEGSFHDSVAQGTIGTAGAWAQAQSSGQAGFRPPGSSANSSTSNLSQDTFYFPRAGFLTFSVQLSLATAVNMTAHNQFAVDYADFKVYVDATQVFGVSSVASCFGTDVSQSTALNETTPLMSYFLSAGLHTVEVIPYTNGYAYTPNVAPTPEPSSMALLGTGAGALLVMLPTRRYRRSVGTEAATAGEIKG
jgi:hypothetical protein